MSSVEEFTEYGYCGEYPDGHRCAISPLGTDRDQALGYFRTYRPMGDERLVFVARRVTRTAWTDEDTEGAAWPTTSRG
ncbi:hypothetical protein [Streptacidiphilus sp. EB129]|uniref:hypothetical protein n=1 Tax=Streptacidiphilus sp. EB129 TaxID=3156262 RepID=UPI003514DC91